jgi:hypothetical protein
VGAPCEAPRALGTAKTATAISVQSLPKAIERRGIVPEVSAWSARFLLHAIARFD